MNRTTIRAAAVAVAVGVAGTGLAATTVAAVAAPAAAAELRPFVLDDGHLDLFELSYDQVRGELVLQVKDDTELYGLIPAYRDPADVTVLVDTATTAIELPEDVPELSFLGAPGETVFVLDQSGMVEGQPWPGWSTERLIDTLPSGVEIPFGAGAIELAVEVSGPGDLFTFMNGGGGEIINRYIDTADPAPDVIPVEPGTHVHTSWVFTEPGDYHLTVTPTATTTGGATLSGPPADYHVHVGDGLPDAVAPQLTVSPSAPTTAAPGQAVTFAVTQEPDTGGREYRWYRWGSEGGYEPLPSTSPEVTVTMPDHDEIVYVVLLAPTGRVLATGSAYLPVAVPGTPTSQVILTELQGDQGLLAISVDPTDRAVVFPRFELSGDATRWETASELRPTQVTDTRSGGPGWTASAQAGDLTSGDDALPAAQLGWAPEVLGATPALDVRPGPVVATASAGGTGIGHGATLASAPPGASQGTAHLGADLVLHAPSEQPPGTYTGLITLTAI